MIVLRLYREYRYIFVTGGKDWGDGIESDAEAKRGKTVNISCKPDLVQQQKPVRTRDESVMKTKEKCSRMKHLYEMRRENISCPRNVRR